MDFIYYIAGVLGVLIFIALVIYYMLLLLDLSDRFANFGKDRPKLELLFIPFYRWYNDVKKGIKRYKN